LVKVEEAIEQLRQGRMIVLADDRNKESSGDLCLAAEKVTPQIVNFMVKFGRGIVCVTLTEDKAREVGLKMMTDSFSTDSQTFAISVDANSGITTGISAGDRATTIRTLVADDCTSDNLNRPGHVFPVVAKVGGVLVRSSRVDASVDLARLAGFKPFGVICGILREDGEVARFSDLEHFSAQHRIPIVTVSDLIGYRLRYDSLVLRVAHASLPTKFWGNFEAIVYNTHIDESEHLALIKGEITPDEPLLVRVHSKYLPGDVFGYADLNTGEILQRSMRMISEEGRGVILYLQVVGRSISFLDRTRKQRGVPYGMDLREYGIGAQILKDLGVRRMRIITNNPKNLVGLSGYGLEIVASVPLSEGNRTENSRTKRGMGPRKLSRFR
jgi:3,4-dihydroxy 2-butanone 4-phosphate synthase/GTP cyclohydrolase II